MQRNSISTPAASICTTRERSKTSCGRSATRKGRTSRKNSRAVRAFTRSGILFTTIGLLLMSISPRYNHIGELVGCFSVAGRRFKASSAAKCRRCLPQLVMQIRFLCFCPGKHALPRQPWKVGQDLRGGGKQSPGGPGRHGGDKFGIDDLNTYIAMEIDDAAHAGNRMCQIKSCSHIRKRQDCGVFNDRAAIHDGIPLYGAAAGNHRAGTHSCKRSDISRRQYTRTFFNQRVRGDPHARLGLLACGAGLCLAGKNVNGKLPQVAGVRQLVEISFMFKKRAFSTAACKLRTKERSSIIAARCADAKNFQPLLAAGHLRDPALMVKMK